MFLWQHHTSRYFKPFMEAAGIEPAQDAPGIVLTQLQRDSARQLGWTDAQAIARILEHREEEAQQHAEYRARNENRPHAVYVATDGDVVKVGYSCEPVYRVAFLSRERRRELRIEHLRWVTDMRTARRVEANAHWVLEPQLHEGREWFRVELEIAVKAVDEASDTEADWPGL